MIGFLSHPLRTSDDAVELCERCGEPLSGNATVWLELSALTGKFQKQNAEH